MSFPGLRRFLPKRLPALALLLALVLNPAADAIATTTFTITASAGTGGTINPTGNVVVNQGSNKSFTITASSGYHIADVLVDGVSVGAVASYSFTNVQANHTIAASFGVTYHTLTLTIVGNGTVSKSPDLAQYPENSVVTLTATPGTGCTFSGWSGDQSGSTNPRTVTMSVNKAITATFLDPVVPTVTVVSPNGGESLPVGGTANLQWTATDNTGVTEVDLQISRNGLNGTYSNIAAGIPNSGSYAWTVSGPTTAQGALRVRARDAAGNQGQDVSDAVFTIRNPTITASAGAGGTISPSGAVSVIAGANQSFTITPSAGYQISEVMVDGSSVGAVSSYTFTNVQGDHTISVGFVQVFTLTVNTVGGGSVTRNPDLSQYPSGTAVTLTAVSPSGWAFSSWSGNASGNANPLSVTMNADKAITATFVDVAAPNVAVVVPNGGEVFTYGATVHIQWTASDNTAVTTVDVLLSRNGGGTYETLASAIANSGSYDWTVSGPTTSQALIKVRARDAAGNVGEDVSNATFTLRDWYITASSSTGGTTLPSGVVVVTPGGSKTFTIVASPNYQILDVKVDGVSVGAVDSYTFSNVTADHTIAASFIRTHTLTVTVVGSGSVTKNPNLAAYPEGSVVQLTAVPGAGYAFSAWSGNASGNANPLSVTMNADKAITATFVDVAAPSVAVVVPNGGEVFTYGATVHIQWTATDNVGVSNVDVLLSRNGGSTYETLASAIANSGSYDWTVSGPTTSQALIKVRARDAAGNVGEDVSNATFTLRDWYITASSSTGGTTLPSGVVVVTPGGSKTFTIVASPNYQILDVKVDGVSVGAVDSYTFTNVTADHTIAASFIRTHTLTVTVVGSGSVTKNPNLAAYPEGSVVQLTAVPGAGYAFSAWSGNASGNANPLSVTMNTDKAITATFVDVAAPNVAVVAPNGGQVFTYGSTVAIQWTASDNTAVTTVDVLLSRNGGSTYETLASAIANSGSYDWTVSGPTTSQALIRVRARDAAGNVGEDVSDATFTLRDWIITASAGTGGTISPSGAVPVTPGASQTFTITASAGYQILDVLVDGVSVGAVSSYTFTNVTADHTIAASFIPTHTLTVTVVGSGSVTKNPNLAAYPEGSVVQLTAVPGAGYALSAWSGNASGNANPLSVTMNTDKAITATFVDVAAPNVAVVAPNGGQVFTYGSTVAIQWTASDNTAVTTVDVLLSRNGGSTYETLASAIANSGSYDWTVSGPTTSQALIRVRARDAAGNVGEDVSDATFTLRDWFITASAGPNGTISPSGAVAVTPGASKTFTITAAAGYHIADVLVDGVSVGAVATYTFTTVTADHTIAASFAVTYHTLAVTVVGSGSVTKSPDLALYPENSIVQLTATPGAGYAFIAWSGGASGNANPLNLTMDTDKAITATFVDVAAPNVAVVAPNGGQVFTYGSSVAIQWTASDNTAVTTVDVLLSRNGGSTYETLASAIANTGSYDWTVSGPTTSQALIRVRARDAAGNVGEDVSDATFTLRDWFITASAGTGGTISPSGAVAVTPGASQTFTITAAAGYHIADVLVDGVSVGAVATYTFTTVTADHTIAASFAVTYHTLAVTVVGSGSVTKSPDLALYPENSVVQLTAVPGSGYAFSAWSGNASGNANPLNLTMDTDKAITATFVDNVAPNVTVLAPNGGEVFTYGATVNLQWTATDNVGVSSVDLLLSRNGGGTYETLASAILNTGSYNWTVSGPTTSQALIKVRARDAQGNLGEDVSNAAFTLRDWFITASAGTGGTISPSGAVAVTPGGSQSFTITASANYQILNVLVDGVSVGAVANYTFTSVTADHTIAASFVPTHTLTVNVVGTGTVTRNPNLSVYPEGSIVQLTAVPGTGWGFSAWSGGASGNTNPLSVTMNTDKTITAAFLDIAAPTVTVLSPNGGEIYNPGATLTVQWTASDNLAVTTVDVQLSRNGGGTWETLASAIPNSGSFNWTVSGTNSTTAVFRVQARDAAGNLGTDVSNAACTIGRWTITATATTGGTITPSGVVTVVPAANSNFTIAASAGYQIADVLVDGASVGAVTSYSFTNVTANHTIAASFSQIAYTLTVNVVGNGTVTKSPNQASYAPGTVVTLTATPAATWSFSTWGGDLGGGTNPKTITMNGNKSVTATFVDAVVPTVTVVAPNGGETLISGQNTTLQWTATDNAGVTAVDLHISRTGPSGSYKVIVSGIPNTGSYTWAVNGPSTQCILRVRARDAAGNQGQDLSNAVFTIRDPIITATAGAGGTISPSGLVTVVAGAAQTFTITPAQGNHVNNVMVDGVSVGTVTTYTFSNVLGDHTIAASFAQTDATPPVATVVSPNGGEGLWIGGSANLTWSATDNVGVTSVDLLLSRAGAGGTFSPIATGIPNSGTYAWTVTGPSGTNNVLKVVARDAMGLTGTDLSDAPFIIGQWAITATAGAGGTITPSGVVGVPTGASRTFTIAATPGFHTVDVRVDNVSVGPVATYTFTAVNANHTIAASFAPGPYTLTVSVAGQGSVTRVPDQATYVGGTVVQVTTSAPPGWFFQGWSGDIVSTANPISVTMNANLAVTATFVEPVLEPSTSAYFVPYSQSLPPAWGDYDNDGAVDLPLYHNNRDGSFAEIPGFRPLLDAGNFHGASWCDYDRDGDLDLVLLPYEGVEVLDPGAAATRVTGTTQNDGHMRLLRNDGNGVFVDVASALGMDKVGFGETAVWADFDADGWPDLFTPFYSHVAPGQSFFFHNNGNGTFTEQAAERGVALSDVPEAFKPEGAQAVDIDDDGDLDLYCASHLFINDGNGYFTDQRQAKGLPLVFDEGAIFVDYDNDGDLDLNLRTASGPRLFRNDGDLFSEVTSPAGLPPMPLNWGDSWADVDNDGDIDAYFMMPSFQPGWLMLNQGNGTFVRDTTVVLADGSGLSSWADYEQDGDLDLLVEAYNRHLFVNTRDQRANFPGSYVRVAVQDAEGRSTQYGATIRLRRLDGPASVQTRVVDGGSGYLSQSEYTVHLGAAPTGHYALEVRFPSRPAAPVVVDSTSVSWLGNFVPIQLNGQLISIRRDGTATLTQIQNTLGVHDPPDGGDHLALAPPAPNPAHGATTLAFRLTAAADVTIMIHDVAGRAVRHATLGRANAGEQRWSWDGRGEDGRRVPSGVYLVRLMVDGKRVAERRIVELN